ncbi:MAG: hypothetical protein AABX30_00360 [Nanoarchaeota archaeon]
MRKIREEKIELIAKQIEEELSWLERYHDSELYRKCRENIMQYETFGGNTEDVKKYREKLDDGGGSFL